MQRFSLLNLRNIPRQVVLLGLVSFFNDLSSEMIYPVVPIFLTSVLHAAVPVVGFIEGFAEATASIAKFLFGAYSDYMQKRKPFVVSGYGFAAVSKPLIGFASTWPLVLFARFIDRLGKGMRTAARDSLLLDNTSQTNRGYIFGFHRAFDSLGAVIGPLLALVFLALFKENIRLIFLIAFVPALIAVLILISLVKEKREKHHMPPGTWYFKEFKWNLLNTKLKLFLLVSFLFAIGNSSDAFLLLYAKHLGLTITLVVLVYVLYNISQTVFATPFGKLSDRIGAKKVFSGGLFVFSLVYFLFGIIHSPVWLWFLFPIYGMYIAATDGVSKAYISGFIKKEASGTFFGAYYTLTAIGNFLASFIGGLLWSLISPSATFFYGSALAILAYIIFFV